MRHVVPGTSSLLTGYPILGSPALPARAASSAEPHPHHVTALAPKQSSLATIHVLVVDENAAICEAYGEVLRAAGYEAAIATSGESALRAVEQFAGSIDVIVVDVNLPDTEPTQLAREILRKIGPRPTLYMSAWAEEFLDLDEAPGRWLLLQVPVDVRAFVEAIEWLAGRRSVRPGFVEL